MFGRGMMKGMMGTIVKALLYKFVGVWAFLFGGFSLRDFFMVPALSAKLGGLIPQLGNIGASTASTPFLV